MFPRKGVRNLPDLDPPLALHLVQAQEVIPKIATLNLSGNRDLQAQRDLKNLKRALWRKRKRTMRTKLG